MLVLPATSSVQYNTKRLDFSLFMGNDSESVEMISKEVFGSGQENKNADMGTICSF